MKLSPTQITLLLAIRHGGTLKSHRYLNGRKIYRLHPLHGEPRSVRSSTVAVLRRHRFIDSNKKFPAATYLLTNLGEEQVNAAGEQTSPSPLTASGWE